MDIEHPEYVEKASKWSLLRKSARLLPQERVAICSRVVIPGKTVVGVRATPKTAGFTNLMRCGGVWTCPVCSTAISLRRGQELKRGIDGWVKRGNDTFMLTFTLSHNGWTPLSHSLAQLKNAYRFYTSGREHQNFKRDYYVVAAITATEITWSDKNGWHPHMHSVVFIRGAHEFSDGLASAKLAKRWYDSVSHVGATSKLDIGLRLTGGSEYTSAYVAKFGRLPVSEGWGGAQELTNWWGKTTRGLDHLTPWGILDRTPEIDYRYEGLWREYATETKGSNQLVKSRDFDAAIGLETASDIQIITDDAERLDEKLFAEIPLETWLLMMKSKTDIRRELLERAKANDEEGFWALVWSIS